MQALKLTTAERNVISKIFFAKLCSFSLTKTFSKFEFSWIATGNRTNEILTNKKNLFWYFQNKMFVFFISNNVPLIRVLKIFLKLYFSFSFFLKFLFNAKWNLFDLLEILKKNISGQTETILSFFYGLTSKLKNKLFM